MMKIAVIGANGQLGTDISNCFKNGGDQVTELNHDQIEISDIDSVNSALTGINADLIINTAAMHHVEKCEEDPIMSFRVNSLGAKNLAQVSGETGSILLHISTDYVFNGSKNKPYIETDRALPLNVYGSTKLSGEHFITAIADKYYILRVSGIFGKNPCRAKGRNFVQTMLKLSKEREEIRVVDDELLTPTFTGDIAVQIKNLVSNGGQFGLYHATAEGSCSWYEFAKEVFSLSKINVVLNPAAPGEFSGKVLRPKYCVLENKYLEDQQLNVMPHWRDGLIRYLQ
jgi:dTDP-4-dehydrorhamnose reductase